MEGTPIRIGLDTGTPFALLAAEVISNACKHAFPSKRQGEITILIEERDGQVRVRFRDNGVGLGLKGEAHGMGQRLIARFVEQLNGTGRYLEGEGTSFELSFPLPATSEQGI